MGKLKGTSTGGLGGSKGQSEIYLALCIDI